MKQKRFFFILFFNLVITSSFSQEKITCRVLDVTSKEPITYATVMLKKIERGTHADLNGGFQIPIKYKSNGIIKISSIGYLSKEVQLSKLNSNGINIIYLSTSNNKLDEVVIKTSKKKKRKLLGIQIVKRAIKNILDNYPTEPHSYIGYYRDYQQPVGDSYQKNRQSKVAIKYLNVHEAIIESFDAGFDSDKLKGNKNQSLLYNYKINTKFIRDSTLTIPYDNKNKKYSESVYITPLGGNELNLLNLTNTIRSHDKMSFSYSNVFQKDFVKNHKFRLKNIVFADSIPLYEVTFSSILEKTSFEYSAYGSIYISKQDFSIYKLNYNLYYRNKKNPQYAVTIEYTPKKGKMYLNYITFNNFFEATNGNYFKIDKTFFNSKQKTFKIYFNRSVALTSIDKRNFKIYYKNKRLKVTAISPFEGSLRIFNVFIDDKSIAEINFENEKNNPRYTSFFQFDITKLKDLSGHEIDKRASIKMNKYREFFVQETFENKTATPQNKFIDKNAPLSRAKITKLKLEHDYWLNTPLKSSKN
ncbi:carboxypeptidase-like regulatory domain-containing protein [Polaribacter sp. L3A8]|uniref:carboxypeptidase-like regulatory domain-containing protein n=1 Tax=Polaribacter sp. L3A8 TaxID=2686361 RepID=UPI00131B93FA|nr:carboxypeptidase-like regulatory domain-containing protein [Polaribacter sp. L3A8]